MCLPIPKSGTLNWKVPNISSMPPIALSDEEMFMTENGIILVVSEVMVYSEEVLVNNFCKPKRSYSISNPALELTDISVGAEQADAPA